MYRFGNHHIGLKPIVFEINRILNLLVSRLEREGRKWNFGMYRLCRRERILLFCYFLQGKMNCLGMLGIGLNCRFGREVLGLKAGLEAGRLLVGFRCKGGAGKE